MHTIKKNKSFILFIFIFYKITEINSSFQKLEKINEEGDYFVVLSNGLYIYNFEKISCEIIGSIENINNQNNKIITSKNINHKTNQTKIATLINQYLYVFTYDGISNNFEKIKIESLISYGDYLNNGDNIYPFSVKINGYNLRIYYSLEDYDYILGSYYNIKSLNFINYSSIKVDEPKIKEENYFYLKPITCQFDSNNLIIKCVYPSWLVNKLRYREINNNFEKIRDIPIEDKIFNSYNSITFTFSSEIDFVCFLKNDEINCFHKKKKDNEFKKISYGFEKNDCFELNSFFFSEKNEFILLCKKSNDYHLFIFNPENFDTNVKKKIFSIPDYHGKISIIYKIKSMIIISYMIIISLNPVGILIKNKILKQILQLKTV